MPCKSHSWPKHWFLIRFNQMAANTPREVDSDWRFITKKQLTIIQHIQRAEAERDEHGRTLCEDFGQQSLLYRVRDAHAKSMLKIAESN